MSVKACKVVTKIKTMGWKKEEEEEEGGFDLIVFFINLCECPDQFTHILTTPMDSEVNDHINL